MKNKIKTKYKRFVYRSLRIDTWHCVTEDFLDKEMKYPEGNYNLSTGINIEDALKNWALGRQKPELKKNLKIGPYKVCFFSYFRRSEKWGYAAYVHQKMILFGRDD